MDTEEKLAAMFAQATSLQGMNAAAQATRDWLDAARIAADIGEKAAQQWRSYANKENPYAKTAMVLVDAYAEIGKRCRERAVAILDAYDVKRTTPVTE